MPASHEIAVQKACQRLCEQIAEYNMNNPTIPVSISVGWSVGNLGAGKSAYELIEEADKLMYVEKDSNHLKYGVVFKEWLEKYMGLLTTIKGDALPPGSMRHYRAPQFEGRFTTKIKNQFILNGSFKDGVNAIGRQIRNKFVENSNDFDFGADNTYNRREDDMFGDDLDFEKEKLNRIPLFGINKL